MPPDRTTAFIASLLGSLLLVSCSRTQTAAPRTVEKPAEPDAKATELVDRQESREKWLLSASAIFPPKTPLSEVKRVLGQPDREVPGAVIYHRAKNRSGRVQSIRFILDPPDQVERVERLDAKGDPIVIPTA